MTLDEAADEFNAVSIEVTLQIMERFMRPTLNINPYENREQYGYDREVTDKLEKEIRDTIVRVGNYFEEMKKTFKELYIIKFEYQKEDGFYETSEAEVLVDVFHGVNEKCNHDKAEARFLLENKNLKDLTIKCVTYV